MNTKLVSLAALLFTVPVSVFAQIAPNNNYAQMIQSTNSMLQLSISQTRAAQASAGGSGSGSSSNQQQICLVPYQLQRGPSAVVPPQLQGDPLYQDYLRCLQNKQLASQQSPGYQQNQVYPQNQGYSQSQSYQQSPDQPYQPGPQYVPPPAPAAQHLPLTASDFVPVVYGHPLVDQTIASMQLNFLQRAVLRKEVENTFQRVAKEFRVNNIAVSMSLAYATAQYTMNGTQLDAQQSLELVLNCNDNLANSPQFAQMSTQDKQNYSDTMIFQTAVIVTLRNMGRSDPSARQQEIDLARVVLQRLGS